MFYGCFRRIEKNNGWKWLKIIRNFKTWKRVSLKIIEHYNF
jgi:hypothetical protein